MEKVLKLPKLNQQKQNGKLCCCYRKCFPKKKWFFWSLELAPFPWFVAICVYALLPILVSKIMTVRCSTNHETKYSGKPLWKHVQKWGTEEIWHLSYLLLSESKIGIKNGKTTDFTCKMYVWLPKMLKVKGR